MNHRAFFSRCAQIALSAAVGAAVLLPLSADAAPIFVAPSDVVAAPKIENVYWTQSCWWVDGPYGQVQHCRQVWVPGPYVAYPYAYPVAVPLLPPPPPHPHPPFPPSWWR